jgi:hypothetical protein
MAIDIGPGATDRATQTEMSASGETETDQNNPANADGTLDTFEVFLVSWGGNLANTKIGTFSGSGTSWTSRDYESVGTVTAGSKQTFTNGNCDVVTNDIIGIFGNTAGYIELDTTGGTAVGVYAGDAFTGSAITFSVIADWMVSLYGTGTETASGWTHISKFNGIGQASIGKVKGVPKASVGKVMGVAV